MNVLKGYLISFRKRRGHLLNLETVRCGAQQRAALIRGRRIFQCQEIDNIKCQNLFFFFFKIRILTYIFTVNRQNIMRKSKYQQYLHCLLVCILLPYAFWFSFQQNIGIILISAVHRGAALIRGEALIRGKRLFQWRHPKEQGLLEGSTYLMPGTYQRKYDNTKDKNVMKRS